MKILFLQLWYDLYGGIESVNDTLAGQFKIDRYDARILCLWKKGKGEETHEHNYEKYVIDNEPVRASYKKMVKDLLHFKFVTVFKGLLKSLKYYYLKRKDYNNFTKKIKELDPEFLIVSNPELIKYVPKKYLKNTVIHMHSGMQVYDEEPKLTNLVLKYSSKVNRIIWLTPNFMNKAKEMGFSNSTYMLNPVRIKSSKRNDLNTKKVTFIGRLCDQKRPEELARIFLDSNLKDWVLQIGGTGEDRHIPIGENIVLLGGVNNVKEVLEDSSVFALTSWHEGFPMVVLEAYECGIPVIVYDYGISASELIIDGKTGFIIPYGDKEEYIKKLTNLCSDDNLRKEMGKNAKEFVKSYYPEVVCQRWYKLFRGEL